MLDPYPSRTLTLLPKQVTCDFANASASGGTSSAVGVQQETPAETCGGTDVGGDVCHLCVDRLMPGGSANCTAYVKAVNINGPSVLQALLLSQSSHLTRISP